MILKYIAYRKLLFLFALLSAALGGLFWHLGGAPLADVAYFLLLLLAALVLTTSVDFFVFRRRRKQLAELRESIDGFEEALPEGHNAIEQAYADITAALLDRLRRETDALEKAHRQDIEYYTLWVHQIKTPLSALSLLIESDGDKGRIAQELFHIQRYVEMALSYARSSSIAGDTVIESVDVAQVVHGCVRKYAPLFIARRLSVQVEGSATAYTDAKWLSFILEQLLSNAAKYTHQGSVAVRIGEQALTVEDTGVGIRSEDLPRVFERGYTGYNGRMDKRASGLGLAMSKQVADALGIVLHIESEVGRGTRVTLSFPRRPAAME